ncbi:amino acid permease [bacterium]|nr:amino acid permease [bacterium]
METTTVERAEQKLVRAVGRKEIVALTVNAIIGAGIFVVPATVSAILGIASPIAFVFAGLFCILIVLCFAELGGRYDRTGGAYLYASEAFGGGAAFLIGWLYFLARLTSIAALTNAFIGFISYFYELRSPFRELVIIAFLGLLGYINYRGIRTSSRIINFLTVTKLAPLLTFIIAGFIFMNWDVYKNISLPQIQPFTKALLLCMFAFTGFEVIGIPGGEMTNARRDIPIGILIGTGITIAIYLSVQFVAVAIHPGIANSKSPIAEAAQIMLGTNAGTFMTIGAICSVVGTLMGLMLAGPRIIFAMSMQHQMPARFAKVHPVFRTPSVSIAFFAILSILVTLSSGFANLATLSAMARLVTYMASAVALIVLRKTSPSLNTFRLPGGPVIPILTILLSIFLLTAATREQWIAGICALIAGLVLYFVARRAQGS